MDKRPKSKKRKQPRQDKTRMTYLIVICGLLAVLVTLLIVFFVVPAVREQDGAKTASDGWYDPAAKMGNLPGRTKEEIQAELNKIVEEGMFNISIASIIVFPDGESEGAARIENIAANRYNMSVTITPEGEDEPVYTSKGLKPGQYIENIRLDRDLPKGEYSATALFTAYTQEDLLKVGQAAAKITLIVEK